jgi:choline dehydrogenase-like flavoprotein
MKFGFKLAALRLMLVPVLLMPALGFPEPPDSSHVLESFRQTAAAEYRYEETRTLEMMAAPWKGSGYLFSSPDGTLIKLQLAPEKVIMAISGDRMLYYDAAHGERQSASLSFAGPMAEQIGTFRAILQGRAEELKAAYDIRSEIHGKHWTLRLTAKERDGDEPGLAVEISGDTDQPRRHIAIQQPDGEKAVYVMEKTGEGKQLEAPMQRLLSEATEE